MNLRIQLFVIHEWRPPSAVQQLTAGNPRRAMDYIKEGLGIAPDDPGLRKLRRDIRSTAQRDAEAARRRAVDAGLSTSSSFGPRTRISRRGTAAQKPVARRRRLESIGRRRRVFGAPRPTPCHLMQPAPGPVTPPPAPAPGPKPADPVVPPVPSESSLVALFDAAIKNKDAGEARRLLAELERLYRNSAQLARMRSALAALEAPPPPAAGFNEAGARDAVETFAKAFSTLDPAAVRNLYPTAPDGYVRALEKFRKIKGYRMIAIVDRVRLDGTRASVVDGIPHGVPVEEELQSHEPGNLGIPVERPALDTNQVTSQRRPLPIVRTRS